MSVLKQYRTGIIWTAKIYPEQNAMMNWGAEASKENDASLSNSPKASPKAAGVKTKVTNIRGSDSPLKPKLRPGSEARAKANQSSLQDATPAPAHRVSEAKRKAIFESHVFSNGPATPLAHDMSELKLREHTGHDIFNQKEAPEVHQRNVLGGVRKAPGGGSSLSMQDYHPATPAAGARPQQAADGHSKGGAKGGEGTFKFGW